MSNKALIVDDRPDNLFLLAEILNMLGYSSDSRPNGLEGLHTVSQNEYQVVFMDIEMPVKNGFEATTEIRTTVKEPNCFVPIIAISAHPQYFFEQKIEAAGFTDYISKPYTFDKVKAALTKLNLL